jgi:phosphoenolpyruvate-protein kinase (PTS system EI component)
MTAYRGTPVSDGIAIGVLYLPDRPAGTGAAPATGNGTVTVTDVRAAFAAVAAERDALAGRLRAAGRAHEADIVAIGALIAADPALSGPALAALAGPQAEPETGRPETGRLPAGQARRRPDPDDGARIPLATASAAISAAAEAQASVLESLPDPDLAQRAGDVRQVAVAVAARLAGTAAPPPPDGPFILVRQEVDPADLIRLADGANLAGATLVGAVSVGGGASSHAAIIARGLGLPMLAGADPAVLAGPGGRAAVLDGGAGELLTDPSADHLARAAMAAAEPGPGALSGNPAARGAGGEPGDPGTAARAAIPGQARTADGELVTILCNVASAAETRLGLANGAAGVGLLRTEIPFTHASGWPSRDDHLAALAPVFRLLAGRRAVVRLLDFAGDKVPPFPGAEGLTAFLHAPGALAAQLAAILAAGAGADLSVMIPMVRSPREVDLVRGELARAAKSAGVDPPPLGMMVELAVTAQAAPGFAGGVDFFSIGTNDLTADVLGRDRCALRPSDAAHPAVLTAIAGVVRAARETGIGLSVCGDAAADPAVLPSLLALGVRTVSVGAAKVPAVARWISQTTASVPGDTTPGIAGTATGSAGTAPGAADARSGRAASPHAG